MKRHLYLGTYTNDNENNFRSTGSQGIYHYYFDSATGKMEFESAVWCENPSYLAIGTRPDQRLYAVSEVMETDSVSVFQIKPGGGLQRRFTTELSASWACHIDLLEAGGLFSVSHYWSGNLSIGAVDPVEKQNVLCDLRHHGKAGEGPSRVHSSRFSPDGGYLIAADLGLNLLMNYQVNKETGWLSPNPHQPYIPLRQGEGPRHMVFHPSGRTMYLCTEQGAHVIVYGYEPETGILREKQAVSTLPKNYSGKNMVADIQVSADGNYLYVSNRGHNSVACFRVREDGGLECVGIDSCCGDWPRGLCVTEDMKFLLIANQYSGQAAVCPIRSDGRIGKPAWVEKIPMVSCAAFLPE